MHAFVPNRKVVVVVIALQKYLQRVDVISSAWRNFMRILSFFLFYFWLQGRAKDELVPEIIAIVSRHKVHDEKQVSAFAEGKIVEVLADYSEAVLAEQFFFHVVVEREGEFLS